MPRFEVLRVLIENFVDDLSFLELDGVITGQNMTSNARYILLQTPHYCTKFLLSGRGDRANCLSAVRCAVAKIPTLFSLSPIQDLFNAYATSLWQTGKILSPYSLLQKLQGDWEPARCARVFGIVWQEDKMATAVGVTFS